MATFIVIESRTGPRYDPALPLDDQSEFRAHADFVDGLVEAGFIILGGPLDDGRRTVLVVEAESEAAIRGTLANDPWIDTHIVIESIDHWTIRLGELRPG